ncbi:MAG: DCC1-like thiol-disulfide oxidoreductase family protein [Acidobacteriota bacterium]
MQPTVRAEGGPSLPEPSSGTPPAARPLLLFDGVCNLCDALVRFVIDHDGEERFRFAALQSDAARRALEEAGAPEEAPDSLIVIDDRKVHAGADALVAVVRGLGLPWSLLVAALLIPRFVRDPAYAWLARNRYRWFGRQTACRVPPAGLSDRFLDVDEPIRVTQRDEPSREVNHEQGSGLGLSTIPGRFLLVYPAVFMLPFPLTLLHLFDHVPGVADSFLASARAWLLGLHGQATEPIVGWLGRLLTGETPSFEFTGSGDGLASYLGVLLDLIIAGVIATAWWLWRRATPISMRTADACRLLVRYYLAWLMLSYGLSKVFPLQFSEMGPDRMMQTHGDSSPMGLLWTFMGASMGYQMFAGAAEVLGALLLLFRRTALLGALVVAAVMANVFAMNMFFDVPVKLYSFHYLLLALLLALPDVPRLVGFFVANVPVAARDHRPFWHASPQWCRSLGIAKVVLVTALLWANIDSRLDRMRTWGPWAEKSDLRGTYRAESFESAESESGTPVAPEAAWLRVGLNPPRSAAVQFADGRTRRLRLALDEEASTLALFDRSVLEPPSDPLQLERLDDASIRLSGVFEGAVIDVTLRREEGESLYESRGFRWINEVPFNR